MQSLEDIISSSAVTIDVMSEDAKRKAYLMEKCNFSAYRQKKGMIIINQAIKSLGLGMPIIMKRPNFSNSNIYSSEWEAMMNNAEIRQHSIEYKSIWAVRHVMLDSDVVEVEKKKLFGRIERTVKKIGAICLWEIQTDEFKGDVPMQVLETVAKAKEVELFPCVWFVSSLKDFYTYCERPKDPAVVGYPIVAYDEERKPQTDNSYCVLLGIWGHDIEKINAAVERANPNEKFNAQK